LALPEERGDTDDQPEEDAAYHTEHNLLVQDAVRVARLDFLLSAVDIVRLASGAGIDVIEAGRRFFAIGARFKLDEVPASPIDTLRAIGQKRGCIRSGGIVDLHKAGDILVHEFRNGTLGRISLEAPSDPP